MLGELERKPGRVVVSDFQAGVVDVSRFGDAQIDVLVALAEPLKRSAETGRRLLELAEANGVPHRLLVANRVADAEDLAAVRRFSGDREPDLVIPEDEAVAEADRRGVAPLDLAADSPVVRAVDALADEVVALNQASARGRA